MTAVDDAAEVARLTRQAIADHARIAALEAQVFADRELIAQLRADGEAAADKIDNLELALLAARRIGAAVGVVMTTYKLTSDDAFAMLRQASQARQVKIRDLADDVVLTGMLNLA